MVKLHLLEFNSIIQNKTFDFNQHNLSEVLGSYNAIWDIHNMEKDLKINLETLNSIQNIAIKEKEEQPKR